MDQPHPPQPLAPAGAYPVQYSVDYPDRPLNRLTTFFRVFMVIPIAIVLSLVEGGFTYGYGGLSVDAAHPGTLATFAVARVHRNHAIGVEHAIVGIWVESREHQRIPDRDISHAARMIDLPQQLPRH